MLSIISCHFDSVVSPAHVIYSIHYTLRIDIRCIHTSPTNISIAAATILLMPYMYVEAPIENSPLASETLKMGQHIENTIEVKFFLRIGWPTLELFIETIIWEL